MNFPRASVGYAGIMKQQQSHSDMQANCPTPSVPVAPGAKGIKRNMFAYRFYLAMFVLFTIGTVLLGLAIFLIWYHKQADDVILLAVELGVTFPQAITFGMAALQKKWLLEGDVPWKLSPLALCPLLGIIVVGILYHRPPSYTFTGFRIILYFFLAFWDDALPYSYVEKKANSC